VWVVIVAPASGMNASITSVRISVLVWTFQNPASTQFVHYIPV
jgi:hypothetical protein